MSQEIPYDEKIREAYLQMARKARYRALSMTAMPSEQVSDEQLLLEAQRYADTFLQDQESAGRFFVGFPEFRVQRALVYTIEAARQLSSNSDDIALLNMAAAEIDTRGEK